MEITSLKKRGALGRKGKGSLSSRLSTATHFLQARIPHGTVPESDDKTHASQEDSSKGSSSQISVGKQDDSVTANIGYE